MTTTSLFTKAEGNTGAEGTGAALQFKWSDPDPPLHHRDGRGGGAGRAHRGLDLARDLQIAGMGQAVGDDGGFEGDDRRTAVERACDFKREGEVIFFHYDFLIQWWVR